MLTTANSQQATTNKQQRAEQMRFVGTATCYLALALALAQHNIPDTLFMVAAAAAAAATQIIFLL